MKRFLMLLAVACVLQACKKEPEVDWSVDDLTVTITGELSDVSNYFDAGDGNWGVNVAPDFGGAVTLEIKTGQAWELDVEYLTPQEEEWVFPEAISGEGNQQIEVDIASNTETEYRKAILTIHSKGNIPVQKKVTIVQKNLGIMEVEWESTFMLSEDEMVFGPNERQDVRIGVYNALEDEVEASSSEGWAKVLVDDGQIYLQMDPFDGTGEDRSTHLQIKNLNGGIQKNIELTQYASEDLSDKSNWSIEAGNDKTTATGGDPITNIIDGNINSHWQWNWPSGETSDFPNTPYEFIIDIGSSQIFNTFSVWQTQSATNGFVKDIQVKVSDDKSEWTDLGVYRMANSTEEAIAQKPDANTYALPKVYNKRYIRLIVLSNVGDASVNHFKNAYLGEFSAYLK